MKILLFLAPPLSLHNLSCFRQGKAKTASGSSVSGTAHADDQVRALYPAQLLSKLPGNTRASPVSHPSLYAWRKPPRIFSYSCPAAHGPAHHRSLFKMAKCVAALQHKRGCKMWNDVVVVKEVYKLLNTTCWWGRAFLFPLLDKRLVREHLLYTKNGKGGLWLSPVSQIGGCFGAGWSWVPNISALFCILACSVHIGLNYGAAAELQAFLTGALELLHP